MTTCPGCDGLACTDCFPCGSPGCQGMVNPRSLQSVMFHEHRDLKLPVPDIEGKRLR